MRRLLKLSLILSFCLVSASIVRAQAPPAGGATAAPPQRGARGPAVPATQPTAPRNEARHNSFLEIAKKGDIELLFVGDSITDWWGRGGKPVWEKNFASMKPANFGIAGDTTNGVLWRMQNGELDGFKARLIVLMLGTNNLNRNPNAEIAAGDALIVKEFKKRQPQAKVLILGVFPRGAQPDTPARNSIKEINAELAKLADNKQVFYLDIGDKFLAADGTLPIDIMADGLHPTEKGYQVWADAIGDKVKELMR